VAQELGDVIRHRDSGGQGVGGGLGRGDADHRTQPGGSPEAGGLGQQPRLAGPGGGVDHRDELAVGQRRQRRGGLVHAQPSGRALVRRVVRALMLRAVRAAGQRILKPRRVGAERVRGLRARHPRRAVRACVLEHALFHGQLRAGGVPDAAVPPVNAAPVGAQQACRHLRRLRRLQAGHRLELRPQRPVG
jgi:hypothetical protein